MPVNASNMAELDRLVSGCRACPRLVSWREEVARVKRAAFADWEYWGRPVPGFGPAGAALAIVGLAPAAHGANRTGRPFTGDFAGLLLYETLLKFGLAEGRFEERPDDGLRLKGVAILNSVKCVPPQNKPTPEEIATCTRTYFRPALAALPGVHILVALGRIAHDAAVRSAGGRLAAFPFGHLAEHRLPDGRLLIDSYHCSRYNQNTNRLTRPMFEDVFERAVEVQSSSRT
jgi:uracil-DNA glycosylase